MVPTQRPAPASRSLQALLGHCWGHTGTSDGQSLHLVETAVHRSQGRTCQSHLPPSPPPPPGGSELSPSLMTPPFCMKQCSKFSAQCGLPGVSCTSLCRSNLHLNTHGVLHGKRIFLFSKHGTVCTGQKLLRAIRPQRRRVHRHSWLEPYLLPQGGSNFSMALPLPGQYQPPSLFRILSLLNCGPWQCKRLFLAEERRQQPWDHTWDQKPWVLTPCLVAPTDEVLFQFPEQTL